MVELNKNELKDKFIDRSLLLKFFETLVDILACELFFEEEFDNTILDVVKIQDINEQGDNSHQEIMNLYNELIKGDIKDYIDHAMDIGMVKRIFLKTNRNNYVETDEV